MDERLVLDHSVAWRALLDAVATSASVRICSPWLSTAPVEQLLSALPPTSSLRVVFRWPQSASDLVPLSMDGLKALLVARDARPDQIGVEWVDEPLHAKVYLVDERALVTSANLTGAGFGLHSAKRTNIEVGVWAESDDVGVLRDWFDGLNSRRLELGHLDTLMLTKRQLPATTLEAPPAPASSMPGASPIEEALRRGQQLAVFRDPTRESFQGLHHVYRLGVRGFRGRLWKFSVSASDDDGLHFDTRPSHLVSTGRRRLTGLVFVPDHRLSNTPIVIVPIDELYHPRHGLRRGAWRHATNLLRVTVEPWDERWWLVIHSATGVRGAHPVAATLRPVVADAPSFLRLGDWLTDPAQVRSISAT